MLSKSAAIKHVVAQCTKFQVFLIASLILAAVWRTSLPTSHVEEHAVTECMQDQSYWLSWVLPTRVRDSICGGYDVLMHNVAWLPWIAYALCIVGLILMNGIFAWLGAAEAGITYTGIVCAWLVQNDISTLARRSGGVVICLALPYVWHIWKQRRVRFIWVIYFYKRYT